tara:strand:+ start:1408 stop:1632 length:225 start_codon:yes stop_codon:yes gene_type:complete
MILDPNIPEDLYSIEKCRNIKNEIMNFGVNNREILKIIDMLSLELEEVDKMKKIQEVLKSETIINKEEKPNIVL